MASNRKAAADHRHATFMLYTLGPDLIESGYEYTGKDVKRCGRLMLAGKKSPTFARFLKGTLIPDLRESGAKHTADDLARCARAIDKPARKPARRR